MIRRRKRLNWLPRRQDVTHPLDIILPHAWILPDHDALMTYENRRQRHHMLPRQTARQVLYRALRRVLLPVTIGWVLLFWAFAFTGATNLVSVAWGITLVLFLLTLADRFYLDILTSHTAQDTVTIDTRESHHDLITITNLDTNTRVRAKYAVAQARLWPIFCYLFALRISVVGLAALNLLVLPLLGQGDVVTLSEWVNIQLALDPNVLGPLTVIMLTAGAAILYPLAILWRFQAVAAVGLLIGSNSASSAGTTPRVFYGLAAFVMDGASPLCSAGRVHRLYARCGWPAECPVAVFHIGSGSRLMLGLPPGTPLRPGPHPPLSSARDPLTG
jgi:hypothetical protein